MNNIIKDLKKSKIKTGIYLDESEDSPFRVRSIQSTQLEGISSEKLRKHLKYRYEDG